MEDYSQPIAGPRFNTTPAIYQHASPRPGPCVPDAHQLHSLNYDVSQVLTKAQLASIQNTGIMAFHCVGDTGEDSSHGVFGKNKEVGDMMETESKAGNADSPCFCFHLGDVIYPGGDEDLYEDEFYQPFANYGPAILPVPGNHDYYGDKLKSFANNFMQPKLNLQPGHRPEMNLPWFYWTLETPVATIIGLAAVSNNISSAQQQWFNGEVANADSGKALIVAVHYPPFSFDGHSNTAIQKVIDNAFNAGGAKGRVPDLVVSGHSHNYQRIDVAQSGTRKAYTSIVAGAGGVTLSPLKPHLQIVGASLKAYNNSLYGALTVVIDSKKRVINGIYNTVEPSGQPSAKPADSFSIQY